MCHNGSKHYIIECEKTGEDRSLANNNNVRGRSKGNKRGSRGCTKDYKRNK